MAKQSKSPQQPQAPKTGADKLAAAGAPPQLAAQLADTEKVGRLFGGGGLIAFIRKLAPIIQKDGPIVMALIGPLETAIASGDWTGVINQATTLGPQVWAVLQDLFNALPAPQDVPAPPAA